ncbi:MAG TPA: arylamine N-acetyltransferase [Terriglobales bacterium]|nr:arylamine N-acetyltransferase [Terriglobales bacterium]
MDLQAYLERIGYSGPAEPTLAVLRDVHRHHLLAVPFENLDIPLHREIRLDLERIFDKIVGHRRGGFCYEQNGLFAWALREIGFDLDMLSARVARADGSYGRDFDHMLLLVRVAGGEWLADVGYGECFVEPLRFDTTRPQLDRGIEYQVVRDRDGYLLLRRQGEDWKREYLFTLTPRRYPEYAEMCVYHQTSPESSFTHKRLCSLATPQGRITLTERTLTVTEAGKRTETPVASVAEFERLLIQHFGIGLTGFPPVHP